MPDSMAFLFRELCGCASAVTVEDIDTLHYVTDLAGWKQRKTGTIERVTVEVAREELARTFKLHPGNRRNRKLAWSRPHQE